MLLPVLLGGCAIPVGESSSGGKSPAAQIAQLKVGVTTRQEVVAILGYPLTSFEEERAIGYYSKESAVNPLMAAFAVFGLLCCFAIDAPLDPTTDIQYMVLIQFDAEEKVKRVERVTVRDGEMQHLNERLQKWAKPSSDR